MPAADLKSGTRIGEYLLEEPAGRGAFAEVWRARHHFLPSAPVALKIPCDPDGAAMLRRAAARPVPAHPGIVGTLGGDPWHDPPYLVLEWVAGPSLREVLRRHGRLPWAAAAVIGLQTLEALAHAHAAGHVHGDLKPENILLNAEAAGDAPVDARTVRARITDFGFGSLPDAPRDGVLPSAPWPGAGGAVTPEYLAPECRLGGTPPDARSDLYAFGVLLYEMLTGRLPTGAFPYPSERLPEIPPAVDAVIRGCLRPDPADRRDSAAAVRESLRAAADAGLPAGAEPTRVRRGGDEGVPVAALADCPPFEFRDGRKAASVRDLVAAADADPTAAGWHLFRGDFDRWLRRMDRPELARICRELVSQERNPRVAVERFLEATGYVGMPRATLDLSDLESWSLPAGATGSRRVFLSNRGRGFLYGRVRLAIPPADWLKITPLQFEGNEVTFDLAAALPAAGRNGACAPHAARVTLETNAGTFEIPIAVAVEPPAPVLQCPEGLTAEFRGDRRRLVLPVAVGEGLEAPLDAAVTGVPWLTVSTPLPRVIRGREPLLFKLQPSAVPPEAWAELPESIHTRVLRGEIVLQSGAAAHRVPFALVEASGTRFFSLVFGFLLAAFFHALFRLGGSLGAGVLMALAYAHRWVTDPVLTVVDPAKLANLSRRRSQWGAMLLGLLVFVVGFTPQGRMLADELWIVVSRSLRSLAVILNL